MMKSGAAGAFNEPAAAMGWSALRDGLGLSHAGDVRALTTLRQAHQALLAADDGLGTLLSAAALLVTAQVNGSFRDFRTWLAYLAPLRGDRPWAVQLTTADERLLGLSALVIGQLFFDLHDPAVDAVVNELVGLLEQDADINLQLAAARLVMYYIEPHPPSCAHSSPPADARARRRHPGSMGPLACLA